MSLPGLNNPSPVREDGSTTMVTSMIVVSAIFMLATVIVISSKLSAYYDKFLWEF